MPKNYTRNYNEEWLLRRDQIEMMIEYYQQEECLWNLSSPDYYKKDARDNALRRIFDKLTTNFPGLNGSIERLKMKLQNLRSYYTKEVGKIAKSTRGGDGKDNYISSWIHFEQLDSFLRSQIIPRTHHLNEVESNCQNEDDETEDKSSHCSDNSLCTVSPNAPKKRKVAGQSPETDEVTEEVLTVLSDVTKRLEVPKEPVTSVFQREPAPDEDEDVLFCRYITAELRKIKDPKTKAFVKFRIHSLLYECQFGNHGDQTENCGNCVQTPSYGTTIMK